MSLTAVPPIELGPGEQILWWERHRIRLDRFARRGSVLSLLIGLLVINMQLLEHGLPDYRDPDLGTVFYSLAALTFLGGLVGMYLRASATELTVTNERIRVATPGDIRLSALSSVTKIRVLKTGVVFEVEEVQHESVEVGWFLTLFVSQDTQPGHNQLVFPGLRDPERLLEDLRAEGLLGDEVSVSLEQAEAAPTPVLAWLQLIGGVVLIAGGLLVSTQLERSVLGLLPFLVGFLAGLPLFVRGITGVRARYVLAEDGVTEAESILARSPPPDDP